MARVITIDPSGRLVVPKDLRDRLQLRPGSKLAVRTEGNALVLEPLHEDAALREVGGLLVVAEPGAGPWPDHRELREERLSSLAGDDPR